MDLKTRIAHVERMVTASLPLWDISSGARISLINVSENFTFLILAPDGFKSVLRVHRQDYHSPRAIDCELAWIEALRMDSQIATPEVMVGRNGAAVQNTVWADLPGTHAMVMFKFIEGEAPREDGDLVPGFEELGALAAQCHTHAVSWTRPEPFERLTWDAEAVFGAEATWGDWRAAPGVDAERRAVLEQVETRIRTRLSRFGKAPERFNLIHADMRLANLIISPSGTRVIDFDDCGLGWLIYDFAAAISFFEDDPRVPSLKAAWLKGYRRVRALSAEDETEIDTMVMLRRMALLAWIGSHIEAPEPQAMAGRFAPVTVELGLRYLDATS